MNIDRTITYAHFGQPLRCKRCFKPMRVGYPDNKAAHHDDHLSYEVCCTFSSTPLFPPTLYLAWMTEPLAAKLSEATGGALGTANELRFVNRYMELA